MNIPGRTWAINPARSSGTLLSKSKPFPEQKDNNWKMVPLGEAVDGGTVYHDFSVSPHVLLTGHAGSGKSGMIRNFLHHAFHHQNKLDVIGVDLKRAELQSYNTIPNFTPVVTLKEALAVLTLIREEMLIRYELIEKIGVNHFQDLEAAGEPDHKVKLIVVEEAYHLLALSRDTRSIETVEEDFIRQAVRTVLNEIVRLGRASGVWSVFSTNQPSFETFNGELNANMSTRVLLGKSDQKLSELMFDNPTVGQEISGIPGRAVAENVNVLEANGKTLNRADKLVHLQTFYTPMETIIKKYGMGV